MQKVIFDEAVQRIFDSFAACFGVRIAFFSPDIEELKVGLNERNSRFCTLLQQPLRLQDRCRRDDRIHAAEAAQSRRLISYVCHAGLAEAVMPVYVDTQLTGYVIIGQMRTTKLLPKALQIAWQQHGNALQDIEEAFFALPYFTPERLSNMLNLFELTVQYLAMRQLIAVDQSQLVETVMNYLAHNIDRPISVPELTAYTGKSASTLARAFQHALGKSLKHAMIELKLDAAEQYFVEHPAATITETATALGFTDPFYFSRLYKKYRHIAPSARIKQLIAARDDGSL
jgi:ligand-binding sensor protein